MKMIVIVFILLAACWGTYLLGVSNGGRTILANGELTTVVTSSGTIKTCSQIGSGSTAVIVCN